MQNMLKIHTSAKKDAKNLSKMLPICGQQSTKAQLYQINCGLQLAQPQMQKWARASTAVFPNMFIFREKCSQVPPVPENYNVIPLP
jgi:hypothetical protein